MLVLGRLGAPRRRRHPDRALRTARRGRCTPRSSGSTSPRSSSASRSTARSPPRSAPSARGSRRSPRPSPRGRPTGPSARPGRRRPRAGRREPRGGRPGGGRTGGRSARRGRAASERARPRSGRLRRHLSVRRDDGGLAVAVADAPVVAGLDVRREVLDDELARREVELALVVAPLDQLVERDVRLVDARVLCRGERNVAGEQDRGSRRTSFGTSFGARAASSNARRPPKEWPIEDGLARSYGLDDRVEVRPDVPRRLPGRVAVAEQVEARGRGGPGARRRAARSAAPWLRTPCRQTTRGDRPGSPHSWSGERHAVAPSASSESGTISARCSSRSFTSDQIDGAVAVDEEGAAMWRSGRLVEDAVRLRRRAVRPEVRREGVLGAELLLPRLRAPARVAGDEDDLGARVAERRQVLLQVAGLVLADLREGERVEDEEDVRRGRGTRTAARARRASTSRSNSGAASPVLTAIRLLLSRPDGR